MSFRKLRWRIRGGRGVISATQFRYGSTRAAELAPDLPATPSWVPQQVQWSTSSVSRRASLLPVSCCSCRASLPWSPPSESSCAECKARPLPCQMNISPCRTMQDFAARFSGVDKFNESAKTPTLSSSPRSRYCFPDSSKVHRPFFALAGAASCHRGRGACNDASDVKSDLEKGETADGKTGDRGGQPKLGTRIVRRPHRARLLETFSGGYPACHAVRFQALPQARSR